MAVDAWTWIWYREKFVVSFATSTLRIRLSAAEMFSL
jgi:hypothetical protein